MEMGGYTRKLIGNLQPQLFLLFLFKIFNFLFILCNKNKNKNPPTTLFTSFALYFVISRHSKAIFFSKKKKKPFFTYLFFFSLLQLHYFYEINLQENIYLYRYKIEVVLHFLEYFYMINIFKIQPLYFKIYLYRLYFSNLK